MRIYLLFVAILLGIGGYAKEAKDDQPNLDHSGISGIEGSEDTESPEEWGGLEEELGKSPYDLEGEDLLQSMNTSMLLPKELGYSLPGEHNSTQKEGSIEDNEIFHSADSSIVLFEEEPSVYRSAHSSRFVSKDSASTSMYHSPLSSLDSSVLEALPLHKKITVLDAFLFEFYQGVEKKLKKLTKSLDEWIKKLEGIQPQVLAYLDT